MFSIRRVRHRAVPGGKLVIRWRFGGELVLERADGARHGGGGFLGVHQPFRALAFGQLVIRHLGGPLLGTVLVAVGDPQRGTRSSPIGSGAFLALFIRFRGSPLQQDPRSLFGVCC